MLYANKFLNANSCWHFNIYEQDKFRAQLSWVWNKFYNLWASSPSYETKLVDISRTCSNCIKHVRNCIMGATLWNILVRHFSPRGYIVATCFPSIIYWCDMFHLQDILVRHWRAFSCAHEMFISQYLRVKTYLHSSLWTLLDTDGLVTVSCEINDIFASDTIWRRRPSTSTNAIDMAAHISITHTRAATCGAGWS